MISPDPKRVAHSVQEHHGGSKSEKRRRSFVIQTMLRDSDIFLRCGRKGSFILRFCISFDACRRVVEDKQRAHSVLRHHTSWIADTEYPCGMIYFPIFSQDRSVDLNKGKEIRVSPYRLAAHLATAFATFSLLVHTGFQVRAWMSGGFESGSSA